VKGLIGHTGFIGSILKTNIKNFKLYNSKNINSIREENFKEIICAGLPASKWKANKYPNKDTKNLNHLIRNLVSIQSDLFILISTIDVHNNRETYGKNRKKLEIFIKKNFSDYLIIRLPAVFGKGIKKNILYDLLNNNQIFKINKEDKYQWFDLSLLYKEIQKLKKNNNYKKIVELYSPPISNHQIIKYFPQFKINKKKLKTVNYKVRPKNGFYKDKKFILNRIKLFIKGYEK
tara:strand:+ start:2887 stop:3585 length:699 start_codon:yes stop_codon:yes gene_type:complete